MNLEPVIGLEIHIELKTKSKMFCTCANVSFVETEPNTSICPICMGYPGTLPLPNKKAIELTQKMGAALNCELAKVSKFDRKSYFYPDLPKAYQISQFDQPFCGEGELEIVVDGEVRKIGIERIHLEEDAAKNTHPAKADYTLVDYNRAGTPLMEMVTKPDLRSPEEAKVFLQQLQKIARHLGVSDADMEKGQMRADANISLREVGSNELHPKTEVKNINSPKFVAKALQFEIERQAEEWEEGGAPQVQSTRGFDSSTGRTTEQRRKEGAADYRYFPEPDIPPFEFSDQDLQAARAGLTELPAAKQARFVEEFGIAPEQAELLVGQENLGNFFESVASEISQLEKEQVAIPASEVPKLVKLAVNLVSRQLRELVGEEVVPTEITPENFAELVALVDDGKISKDALAQVLAEMKRTGGDPDAIIANLGLAQVSDASSLEKFVDEAIQQNPDVVEKIKAGKGGAIQYLMGQVMAKSQGKANAQEVVKMLEKKLLS